MENLHSLERDFKREGLTLKVTGFDTLQPIGQHEHSARKRGLAPMRRIMVIAEESLEERLEREFIGRGATGFTAIPCRGAGRRHVSNGDFDIHSHVRVEVIVPVAVCDDILAFLRREILPGHHATACVETVEAVRADQFVRLDATQGAEVELAEAHH